MIAARLESLSGLAGKYQWVGPEFVRSRLHALGSEFRATFFGQFAESRELDAQDTDTDGIVDWLQAQGLHNESVNVFWLAEQVGISIRLSDCLSFLGDLWFPSSDDVISESQSGSFVILIDHEEQVRLFLRPTK